MADVIGVYCLVWVFTEKFTQTVWKSQHIHLALKSVTDLYYCNLLKGNRREVIEEDPERDKIGLHFFKLSLLAQTNLKNYSSKTTFQQRNKTKHRHQQALV